MAAQRDPRCFPGNSSLFDIIDTKVQDRDVMNIKALLDPESSPTPATGGTRAVQHPCSDSSEPDKPAEPSLIENTNLDQCSTRSLPLTTTSSNQSDIAFRPDSASQSDSTLVPASSCQLVEINDTPVAISCCHSSTGIPPLNDHSATIDKGWKSPFCFNFFKDSDVVQHHIKHLTEQFAKDIAEIAEKYAAEHFSKHILGYAKNLISTPKARVSCNTVTTAIDNGWECYSCKTVLKDSDIFSHVAKHKTDFFKNYKKCPCTDCQVTFTSRAGLVYHLNCNTVYSEGDKTAIVNGWNCDSCQKNFKYSDIDLHIEEHLLNGYNNMECFYTGCDIPIKDKSHYWNHIFAHADPYVCPAPDCPKICTTKALLQSHAREKHHGKRAFGCDWEGCNMRSDWMSQVQTHKKDEHGISTIKRQRLH